MSCEPSLGDAELKSAAVDNPAAGPPEEVDLEALTARCLAVAAEASAEVNAAFARLAMVLPFIKLKKMYSQTHQSLAEYLAEELGMKPSLGAELIRIGTTMLNHEIPLTEYEALDVYKLGIVHKQITPENKQQVLEDVAQLKADELKARYQPPRPRTPRARRTPQPVTPEAATDDIPQITGPLQISLEAATDAERANLQLVTMALLSAACVTGKTNMNLNLAFVAREFLKLYPISQPTLRKMLGQRLPAAGSRT